MRLIQLKSLRRVKVNSVILIIKLFPYLLGWTIIPDKIVVLNYINLTVKILLFCYVAVEYFKIKRFNNFDLFLWIFCTLWMVSAVINYTTIFQIVKDIMGLLYGFMLVKVGMTKDKKGFIHVISRCFILLLLINLICFIRYPNGIYYVVSYFENIRYNFLGIDNQITPIAIIALSTYIAERHSHYYNNKFTTIVVVLIVAANAIMLQVGTCIFGLGIFSLLVIADKILNKKMPGYTLLLIIFFTGFILVVFFNMQSIFSFIIIEVLKKDLTISSRTNIWKIAIEYISEKPILGYGIGTTTFMPHYDRNAHNTVLQLCLQCGISGLVVLTNLLICPCKILKNKQNSILVYAVFAFLIMSISEVYNLMFLILLLSMLYYFRCGSTPKLDTQ